MKISADFYLSDDDLAVLDEEVATMNAWLKSRGDEPHWTRVEALQSAMTYGLGSLRNSQALAKESAASTAALPAWLLALPDA